MTRALYAAVMCSQATHLLAACIIVCVVYLTPTVSQCTTKYCFDDNNDNDVGAMTAMVSRLQNSLEEQEKQHQDSIEQLQQQFNDSLEQQQEYVIKLENTMKKKISTLKQDLQDLNKTCACTTSATTGSPSATDCADLKREGYSASGVYDIRLVAANKIIKVYCDMTTDGGGWLVFQRRQDGSVDFNRDWATYKEGFGDVSGEFWLGNDYLHAVTAQKQYKLRIDLEDFEGATRYAVYSNFTVSDELHNYRLSFGAYSGTAGDSLETHRGFVFSTKDRYNGAFGGLPCIQGCAGGWWKTHNFFSNLNGQYGGGTHASGIVWYHWHGYEYSLKKVEMKLRP